MTDISSKSYIDEETGMNEVRFIGDCLDVNQRGEVYFNQDEVRMILNRYSLFSKLF